MLLIENMLDQSVLEVVVNMKQEDYNKCFFCISLTH